MCYSQNTAFVRYLCIMIVIYVSLKQKKVAEIKIEQDKLLPKHYI